MKERKKVRKKQSERDEKKKGLIERDREKERFRERDFYIPSTAGRSTYRVSLQDRPYPNACSGAYVASLACPKGGTREECEGKKGVNTKQSSERIGDNMLWSRR